MAKISIQRAFGMIRKLTEDISVASRKGMVGIERNGNCNGKSVAEAAEDMSRNMQALLDMQRQLAAVRMAVSLSNLQSKVTIPVFGEVTVAEAISLRDGTLYSSSHSLVMRQLNQALTTIEKETRELSQAKGMENYTADQLKALAPSLVDPNDLTNDGSELQKQLQSLSGEIDIILSEHNASTEIEV